MGRWSTLLIDQASVAELSAIDANAILTHADKVAERRLTSRDLYRRWEQQQWSADEVALDQDREDYQKRLPRKIKQQVHSAISTFIVGEYTGLDLLSPVMLGAPDEQDLVFLGTQVADEARHAHLMFRVGHEVLGYDADPTTMLAQAWEVAEPEHRALAVVEGGLMRESIADPSNYEKWLRSVTLFHLITEGVLAVTGQRAIVHGLSGVPLLPGIRSAFAAMCRDESRHISFGLHALRIGLLEGKSDEVYDVLEQALPLALAMTERLQPSSAFSLDPRASTTTPADTGADSFRRAMRQIGADPLFTEHLISRAPTLAAEGAVGAAHSSPDHQGAPA